MRRLLGLPLLDREEIPLRPAMKSNRRVREFRCPKCGSALVTIGHREAGERVLDIRKDRWVTHMEEGFWCECQRCDYSWFEAIEEGSDEKE